MSSHRGFEASPTHRRLRPQRLRSLAPGRVLRLRRVAGTRWLVGLIALLTAALLAGCGGDTTTVINETTTTVAADTDSTTSTTTDDDSDDDDSDDGGPVLNLKAFQSPSGNIACLATQKFVRCDISERSWTPPDAPSDCPVDYGQGIQLSADGGAAFVCAGDTVLNPQAPVLEYGSSSQVGSITCESDDSGVECENQSGGSFSLSREEYDLN